MIDYYDIEVKNPNQVKSKGRPKDVRIVGNFEKKTKD